jgi:hypothetical protein
MSFPAGQRGGGAAQHEVGAEALGADVHGQVGRELDHVVGQRGGDRVDQPPAELVVGARAWSSGLGGQGAAVVVGQAAADGLGAERRVVRRAHLDGQTEPVEQLWPELALLGVHRTQQHEPGRVLVGDAVALDPMHAGRGGVEDGVDQMVGQQVDLVDVEDAAVGRGQQPGPEPLGTIGQRGPQVEAAENPVLGGAHRQLDERSMVG